MVIWAYHSKTPNGILYTIRYKKKLIIIVVVAKKTDKTRERKNQEGWRPSFSFCFHVPLLYVQISTLTGCTNTVQLVDLFSTDGLYVSSILIWLGFWTGNMI